MRKLCLFPLVFIFTFSRCIHCEDIIFKCNEYDSPAGEPYCTVSGFRVSHNQEVKMEKYAFLRGNSTKYMKFYDSRLLYLPFRLFDVFGNLKTLDVASTEILDVLRNTFSGADTLSYLNMSNNNITQITTSVFVGATSLMRLDLSRNQIEDINEFAFQGLTNLDKLQLSYNRIKQLHKNLFVDNVYMETITLDNNLIEYIEPEVFSRMRRIRDVNLANNLIRQLHPSTFQAAYGLETLMLSSNQLDEFHLTNKSILLHLHLDRNNLTSISINATKTVRAEHNNISQINMLNSAFLEDLGLAHNNLSDITNITSLSGLLYLDLSYNNIGPLNITTFDKLKRLRELYLRSTSIQRLTYGMFSKQTNLEVLDLSYNNLRVLNLKLFIPYLSKLKTFYVDGNNLTEIQGPMGFSVFYNLVKLGISQNRFNCSYLHTILMPPYLSTAVSLHIEPVSGDEESAHIRDISCISNVRETLRNVTQELSQMSELERLMAQSMESMRQHEKKLELFLLLMKIAMFVMVCLLIGVVVLRYWLLRRTDYYSRRGGSIVFHSTNTMNAEH